MQEVKNSLVGSPVFAAKFIGSMDGKLFDLPDGIKIENCNENIIYFKVEKPTIQNPVLIRLLTEKYDLLSFEEVPNKLEDTYLGAINQIKKNNHDD
jgi:hypothetical protein